MRSGSASRKVPGGKLIRVQVQFSDTIRQMRITGDFFLHPEEALNRIEEAFEGADVRAGVGGFRSIIERILSSCNAQPVGFTPQDLAEAISEALK